jgi:hypothetical protein
MAGCFYAECNYAEYHYAECHYAECCGAVLVTEGHFHPSLIFPGKPRAYPSGVRRALHSKLRPQALRANIRLWRKVIDNDKHSSLS